MPEVIRQPRHENELSRWSRLEELLELAGSNPRSLDAPSLRELASLYRRATLDLATHQRKGTQGATLPYLHALIARGRRLIYARSGPTLNISGLWHLFAWDFPRMLRREWKLVTLCALLTYVPAAIGFVAMAYDPAWVRALFPDLYAMMESYGEMAQPGQLATAIEEGTYGATSAFIAQNNIRVSIICYGAGITFGIGTLYLLIFNGTMLGGVAYYYLSRGAAFQEYFYAGILPHGVLELTAIIFSGAAGLMLGRAMLFPGDLPRMESLRRAAPDTLPIVGGVIGMLLITGLIEGFITPSKVIDPYMKMAIGIGSGLIFLAYVLLAGREGTRTRKTRGSK